MSKINLRTKKLAMAIAVTAFHCSVLFAQTEQSQECDALCSNREQGAIADRSNIIYRGVAENVERQLADEVWVFQTVAAPQLEAKASPSEHQINLNEYSPALFDSGKTEILPSTEHSIAQLVTRFKEKRNLRLHFIGHTDNHQLSANAKKSFATNQVLSEYRARVISEYFQQSLSLEADAVSYVGKGDTQPVADNGDATGRAKNRRVALQVSYDEVPVPVATGAVMNRTQVCQATLQSPASSNDPFKISLDGKPLGETLANRIDQQRCTDVALDQAQVSLQYDNLNLDPKLNVTIVAQQQQDQVHYRVQGYSNYLLWTERAELRLFEVGSSTKSKPFMVIPLDKVLQASWQPDPEMVVNLEYRLRVYDKQGRYDETGSQPLWVGAKIIDSNVDDDQGLTLEQRLLEGYGESRLELHNIVLRGGALTLSGKQVPENHQVFFMGMPVSVSADRDFVNQQIVPTGTQGVEIAILDQAGNGDLFWRELDLQKNDWFYVGLADFTLGKNSVSGDAQLVTGDKNHLDGDMFLDSRLAFYTKGRWRDKYKVTASVDTREEAIEDIFSNIDRKDPRSQLRRLEEEDHYSVYGDDSTLVEDAPTQGRFYFKIEDEKSQALWGNFDTNISETDLARIERSLYGAQLQWSSEDLTEHGEGRTSLDVYIAEAGTSAAHEEFRGTGGTLYYLEHQDITHGSEQLSIEVRDKDSGLVLSSQHLAAGNDYDVDSSQGRILLTRPLSSTADDSLLLRGDSLSGNPAFLVVNYEYTAGIADMNEMTSGGRVSHWLTDTIKLGVTAGSQNQVGGNQDLLGGDLTFSYTPETYVKLEAANTDGPGAGAQTSNNGGIGFNSISQDRTNGIDADAYRLETAFKLEDLGFDDIGKGTFYVQHRDAGFSGLGQLTRYETDQVGASMAFALSENTDLIFKADDKDENGGADTQAAEFNLDMQLNQRWSIVTGVRTEDASVAAPAPGSEEGVRTDVAVQLEYQSTDIWNLYGFVQGTADRDDSRQANDRVGLGGSYQFSERHRVLAELSDGNTGFGAKVGSDYQYGNNSNLYINYETDPDFTDNGLRGRNGQLVGGVQHRYSDTTSVYNETRFQNGSRQSGLSHAYGVDYSPNERWSFGVSYETGNIKDADSGEIDRKSVALNANYASKDFKYGTALEYRDDESATEQRNSWLVRNNLGYQLNPDWRTQLRLDVAISDSDIGDSFNSDFTEALLGFAYRPVDNDRFNALVTYAYLADLAPIGQFTSSNQQASYQQRSHVFAFDGTYDLTTRWSIGGKYAYRNSEVRLGRETGEWFDSNAHLYILRADWHVVRNWDFLIEGRMLEVEQADDRKSGALIALHRHFGEHYKMGLGYNFTEFSDDLTHFDYDAHGWFINMVGKF